MPTLTGSLADVVGELLVAGQVRQAFVKAPAARGSLASGDRLIVSAPVPVAASGTISLDLEPGPAVLVVDTYAGGPDVYDLYVTSDMTLLSDALAESAQDRSWSESVMVQLRKEAVEAAEQAALDREQTGLDRVATSEDRTQTGLDRTQTGLDRVATGQDRTATGEDRTQTGLDREQARLDRVATGQDRTQTGLDRVAAAGSASAAETAANEFGLTVTSSQVGPEVPSSATLSGDGPAYAIHLGLSKGRPGDKGDPGEVTTAALNSALAGKADLTGGQVPTSQLPAIALTKPFPVADRAGMLALSAQEGDVAVITGGADKGTYMLSSGPSGTFGSWVKLTVPDAPVQSVNSQTGTVNLSASDVGARPASWTPTKADVGLGNVDNTSDAAKPVSTAQAAAIGAKADKTDPRFTDARTPTSHKHPVGDLTTTGTASASTFLNGAGQWAVPPDTNTTYAVPTLAEAEAGTAATARAFSAQRVRQAADAAIAAREWDGTQAQYDALPTKNPLVTYYVTDA